MNSFWETSRGSVRNDSLAGMDHNSVAFRYKGSVGTGGYIKAFAIDYGTREGWCAIDFTRANDSRKWWIRANGVTASTDKATTDYGQQSIALHRRQVGKMTFQGLDIEQVEMLHTVYPFVLSIMRVTNNNPSAISVTGACSVKLTSGKSIAYRAGTSSFWGDTITSVWHDSYMTDGYSTWSNGGYTMTNNNGLLIKMKNADAWDCSETGFDITAPRNQASSSTAAAGIPVKTVTIQPGETFTFEVIYGIAGLQGWTEAELVTWADTLITYGVEKYCDDERNRVNYWYDVIYSNINIGSQAIKDYLPKAFQYVEEQVITQKSGRQYSLHGGWADESRAVQSIAPDGGGEMWYPYPTSTMHQSFPYHYVQLQTGMDWVVKSELINYALRQNNTDGSMAFHMWPDDVAFPYNSPYTEQMWILSVYDYVAFTQDHGFLTESYNGKTILERCRLAYNTSKGAVVNGLVGGADWHDGWGDYGYSYNSQGSMTHCMMLDAMVEIDPTNAATYSSEASTMRAKIVSDMEVTNNGHTFYKRRVGTYPVGHANYASNAAWATTATWDQAILDSSYWGVIAGVNTVQKQRIMMDDIFNSVSPRGYNFIYAGSEGLGLHNGNNNNDTNAMGWLCYQAWCEKFFEYAMADSRLGNTRCIDIFENPAAAKIRFPEQIDGTALNSGEPTYSSAALVYKWLVQGIFGVQVKLDGSIVADPIIPAGWTDAKIGIRVGNRNYIVTQEGSIGYYPINFDVASYISSIPSDTLFFGTSM